MIQREYYITVQNKPKQSLTIQFQVKYNITVLPNYNITLQIKFNKYMQPKCILMVQYKTKYNSATETEFWEYNDMK